MIEFGDMIIKPNIRLKIKSNNAQYVKTDAAGDTTDENVDNETAISLGLDICNKNQNKDFFKFLFDVDPNKLNVTSKFKLSNLMFAYEFLLRDKSSELFTDLTGTGRYAEHYVSVDLQYNNIALINKCNLTSENTDIHFLISYQPIENFYYDRVSYAKVGLVNFGEKGKAEEYLQLYLNANFNNFLPERYNVDEGGHVNIYNSYTYATNSNIELGGMRGFDYFSTPENIYTLSRDLVVRFTGFIFPEEERSKFYEEEFDFKRYQSPSPSI